MGICILILGFSLLLSYITMILVNLEKSNYIKILAIQTATSLLTLAIIFIYNVHTDNKILEFKSEISQKLIMDMNKYDNYNDILVDLEQYINDTSGILAINDTNLDKIQDTNIKVFFINLSLDKNYSTINRDTYIRISVERKATSNEKKFKIVNS